MTWLRSKLGSARAYPQSSAKLSRRTLINAHHRSSCPLNLSAKIFTCHHRGELIGHIAEQDGKYEARSWPNERLLGTFSHPNLAARPIVDASYDGDPEHWESQPTIKPCQAASDRSLLLERLLELIDFHRVGEIGSVIRFLQERGFSKEDVISIGERAARMYEGMEDDTQSVM